MYMIDKRLKKIVSDWELVGSRVTCMPPPTNTDQDILCLLEEGSTLKDFEDITSAMTEFDILPDYYEHISNDLNDFQSFKDQSGEINFIVTTKKDFYDKFLLATKVAKDFNLLDKENRKKLFQAILYNKYYECAFSSSVVQL